MEKFQNKYRIQSTRIQNWDYGWAGSYYITICTRDREYYFGDVVDGKMILSGIGIIAYNMWHEIKNHGNNVELGEFVVMPDHIHGILILNGIVENNENDCKNADTGYNGIAATNGICTTNGIVEGCLQKSVSFSFLLMFSDFPEGRRP